MTTRPKSARRRGAVVIETAVVLIPLLVVVFAVIEYGRYVMVRQVLENAAREGARLATVRPDGGSTDAVLERVREKLAAQQSAFHSLTVAVYKADDAGNNAGAWTSAGFGDRVAVEAAGTYRPMFPTFGLLPTALPVRARAVMHNEVP